VSDVVPPSVDETEKLIAQRQQQALNSRDQAAAQLDERMATLVLTDSQSVSLYTVFRKLFSTGDQGSSSSEDSVPSNSTAGLPAGLVCWGWSVAYSVNCLSISSV